MHRKPTARELAQLIQRRLEHLPEAIAQSEGYRVLPGVPERLRQLSRDGHLERLVRVVPGVPVQWRESPQQREPTQRCLLCWSWTALYAVRLGRVR